MLPSVETFLQKCYHLWKHFSRNVSTCGNISAEMYPQMETKALKRADTLKAWDLEYPW
jgi:hypothetical protein